MGLLLITHDMGVIAGRADRVAVMYAGRVVEYGATRDVLDRMHHPYTQALLESIPCLDTDPAQRLYSIPGLPPDLSSPPTGCRFAPRCRRAQDRCRSEDPPLDGNNATHRLACFFRVFCCFRGSIHSDSIRGSTVAPDRAPGLPDRRPTSEATWDVTGGVVLGARRPGLSRGKRSAERGHGAKRSPAATLMGV